MRGRLGRSLSVVVAFVVVMATTSAAEPSVADASPWLRRAGPGRGDRAPADGARRRARRRAPVGDVRATFGGIDDAERRERLARLASQDVVAAVLEYNEMVLGTSSGDTGDARTCWMRLNYNVTSSSSSEQLTDLFRDQVVSRQITNCTLGAINSSVRGCFDF